MPDTGSQQKFSAHPWHGVEPGPSVPEKLTAYIEIVPGDTVKYELDKSSGLLKVDRPQRFSNVPTALYGFIPRSYCGKGIAAFCMQQSGKSGIRGDGDPLDICVLSYHDIRQRDILLQARPIGGLRMIDNGEADDKIIAILDGDEVYGKWTTLSELPEVLLERLMHYFLTYKQAPGLTQQRVEISQRYEREEAFEVIRLSLEDYRMEIADGA